MTRASFPSLRRGLTASAPRARLAMDIVSVLALSLLAAVLTHRLLTSSGQGFDFETMWEAGRRALSGESPYPELDAKSIGEGTAFVYPAPALGIFVPLGLLPYTAANVLFTTVALLCVPGGLLLLGVRDYRCFAVPLLWFPTLFAVRLGTITPLLLLGLAALWRYRDRSRISVPVAVALVVLKIFLWPVLLWLLVTRRSRAAVAAAIAAGATTIAAWATIGFHGLTAYPTLMSRLSAAEQGDSFSPTALWLAAGMGTTLARAAAGALGLALLVAAFVLARKPHGERRAFALVIGAALACSPIVWPHYFLLLLVPIALASPRLSPLWFLPLLIWPATRSDGALWPIVLTLSVAALALALAARPQPLARPGDRAIRRRATLGKLEGAG